MISSAKDELPCRWFVTADLLQRCPRLLCVSTSGAGYDTVDVEACSKAGIVVVNQAGINAPAVAEHTLGLILALSKRIAECDRRLRRERGFAREDLIGRNISEKTLGIVGIGHVGTRVARLARAFGMTVLAYDPYVDADETARRGARSVTLDEMLSQSDIVSIHCPRTSETMGMIDARAFARMKQGTLFVTTARGGIYDEAVLFDALQSGHLAGAGLDVWEKEPPPLQHPLLTLENVIATYHTAGVTVEIAPGGCRRGSRTSYRLAQRRPAAASGQPESLAGLSRTIRSHHGFTGLIEKVDRENEDGTATDNHRAADRVVTGSIELRLRRASAGPGQAGPRDP